MGLCDKFYFVEIWPRNWILCSSHRVLSNKGPFKPIGGSPNGGGPRFQKLNKQFWKWKNMYFQTPLHLSWFSTQWRPEASHWVHGGAISRRLMATFASWGACTVTSWSEEEKKDAAPERRRTLGWRVIWGQNIRGKLFRWYFQLLLWNLKTSSLRFKLDLMPPKRLVGRWMKTRRTKRLGEVCHSSSCDRRQIERHGENWYFLIVTWLESEAKYFYSRHFPIQKTSKWVPSVASTRSILR